MHSKNIFFRIYRFLTFKRINNYEREEPNVTEWEQFIHSIPEPQDDIDRAHCRYLCRMHYFPTYYNILLNIVAFITLLWSIPLILKKNNNNYNFSYNGKKRTGFLLLKNTRIEKFSVKYQNHIPEDISKKYGEMTEDFIPKRNNYYLNIESKKLLWDSIKRRPFNFFLNYWIFKELCRFSFLIDKHNTKAIVVYANERNVAGPIISKMCEQKGIDFVSFMHGEYLLQLLHGFIRFTRFYVWDEHYVNMYTENLKCPSNQFIIYRPKIFQGICKPRDLIDSYDYYATYYFGEETLDRIERVAEAFHQLKEKGKKCKVRPHPRELKTLKYINEAFKDFYIEDPYKVPIEESIECTRFIVSLNSTVLSEAYYSGKEIVIDDYSDFEKYQNLENRKYIMIHKPHKLLSELVSE